MTYPEISFAHRNISEHNSVVLNTAPPNRTLTPTQRLQFELHQGKRILVIDYSHCEVEQMKEMIGLTRTLISTQLSNSLLTLSDVTGATFNIEVVEQIKEMTRHNAPYVRKAALVGVTGLQALIYNVVQTFSKRNIPIFSSKEEALKYLLAE